MKRVLFVCMCILPVWNLVAQLELVKTIPVLNPLMVTADPTGNGYLATGNELWMIGRSDTLFRKYSNIQLGQVTTIDATNPMKVLLYYRDQGRIQFLDNNISQFMDPVSLDVYGLEQATMVCTSYDNGFWVYTPTTFGLVRFDQNMKKTTAIPSMQQLISVPEIRPEMMQESSNKIYITDPDVGIFVFDVFGGYIKTIPIKDVFKFMVLENKLAYLRDDGVYVFDLFTMQEEKWTWPSGIKPVDMAITYDKVYLLTSRSLLIFTSGK